MRVFEFSRPVLRSDSTTPRSLSTIFGSIVRWAMRSLSSLKIVSSDVAGNQSWYTVTSLFV